MKTFFSVKLTLPILFILSFNAFSQGGVVASKYPQATAYFSIVHPILTINATETVYNFSNSYTIGFPVGVNILKSDRFGFSFEITPFIKSEGGVSKVNNLLFHPGLMLRYPKGFTINTRLAFETSGRFGSTLVFSKIVARTKTNNYFLAVPIPVRFGNEKTGSIGAGLQLGLTF